MTVVSEGNEGANLTSGLVYFIKAFVGPGCLSLPLAFQNCGLALGSGLLLATSLLVTFNLRTMVLCKQHLASKGIRTYADLTREVLGDAMRRIVVLFINGVQLGICAVYFEFFAESARAIFSEKMQHYISQHALIVAIFPVYGSLALLRSVNSIAPYAALANALVYAAIGIVLFSAAATLHQRYFNGIRDDDLDEDTSFEMAIPARMPLFYATVIYSFEGVCSLLPVENALARPQKDMPTVMYVGMLVVTLTYAAVGAVGYVAWPSVSSGSIAADLTQRSSGRGLKARLPALVANVSTIIAVVLTFPVQLFPALELLEKSMGFSNPVDDYAVCDDTESGIELCAVPTAAKGLEEPTAPSSEDSMRDDDVALLHVDNGHIAATSNGFYPFAKHVRMKHIRLSTTDEESPRTSQKSSPNQSAETPAWKRTIFRLTVVVAIGLVAALIPNLGALIYLIGALTGSVLSLVVPALIDLCHQRPGRCRLEIVIDVFVCIIGVIGAISGTVQAVQNALAESHRNSLQSHAHHKPA